MKEMDLCRPCVEHMRAKGHKMQLCKGGIDKKVDCKRCGRRRYGATYQEIKK